MKLLLKNSHPEIPGHRQTDKMKPASQSLSDMRVFSCQQPIQVIAV